MARSCGIRIGPRRYEVVVLDGSPKKHKIAAFEAGEFDPHAEDPLREATATLKDVAKRLGVPKDNVGLVIDSGHAAFRRLNLAVAEASQIEQVVKFEVESELPQWNIDDVVVDWHMLAGDEVNSELLITAVPKDDISAALDVATSAGVEPFEVELETSAMVNAADGAQLCNLDDAQLLVHLGDYSTSVVVMDAGEVREMRVIHIGALTHEVISAPAPEASDEAGSGDGDAPPAAPEADPIEASRRIDQAIKRIRRELGRTISGARTINPIEAIYVCGIELPGLIGSKVLDVPVYVLDCFEEDSGQPVDGFGQLVTAYGAALRELGGGLMRPALRREELKFTGTWERVEFPLAVACLLLTTFLGVMAILQKRELHWLDLNGTRYWLESNNVYVFGDAKKNDSGKMGQPPPELVAYADHAGNRDEDLMDTDVDPLDALAYIKYQISLGIEKLRRELGQDSAIKQPQSALVGAHMVLQVLEEHQAEWRPSIWKLVAETQPPRRSQAESVKVTLDLVFHAEDGRGNRLYEAFLAELEQMPGFISAPQKSSKALEDGKGVHIQGMQITVNVQEFYDQLAEAAGAARSNS